MLAIPIARRAAGAASLTSVRHEDEAVLETGREYSQPGDRHRLRRSDPAISPRPKPSTSRPARPTGAADTSANRATLPDDINSSAPNPAATRPSPPVDTPWTSSSWRRDDEHAHGGGSGCSRGQHRWPRRRGRRSLGRQGGVHRGGPGATNVHQAGGDAIARQRHVRTPPVEPPDQQRQDRRADQGASAQVSNEPIARLRGRRQRGERSGVPGHGQVADAQHEQDERHRDHGTTRPARSSTRRRRRAGRDRRRFARGRDRAAVRWRPSSARRARQRP